MACFILSSEKSKFLAFFGHSNGNGLFRIALSPDLKGATLNYKAEHKDFESVEGKIQLNKKEIYSEITMKEVRAITHSESTTKGVRAIIHEKALSFANEGSKILGIASLKIITRVFAWGALGSFLGIVIWSILFFTGLFQYPDIIKLILLPVYLIIGAGLLGYAGLWRGLGRTILYVGIKKGLVIFLVEKIFDRFVILLRQSDKISKTIDESQSFVENLPLQIWEDKLNQAVNTYLDEDDEDVEGTKSKIAQRISRRIRGFLCRKIEYYLLKIVREEIDEEGKGGGISVSRVQEVALENLEDIFGDVIKDIMKKKLLICFGIMILVFLIVPIMGIFF